MSDQSCLLAHSDAAYVLGSLSPAERLEYERHLPVCESCRRSVAVLAGLPGLLGRVHREQVESPVPIEPVPATVLPALVAAVRREQRRKSVLITLGAAAAVAAVAFGVSALQSTGDDSQTPSAQQTSTSPTPSTAPARPMEVVVDWGVTADVSLTEVRWGTKVSINCRYADRETDYGGHAYRYDLVVVTQKGEVVQVGSWRAKSGETYAGEPVTATKLRQITRVEVRSERGDTILKLDL